MQKVFNFIGQLLVLIAKVTGQIVKGLWKGGIVGKLILFVIVIGLCGVLAPRGSSSPSTTAQATRTPVAAAAKVAELPAATQTPSLPTSTAAPTVTPGPSATLAPTNTPAPTSTPAPTDTPAPTNTPLSQRDARATAARSTVDARSAAATATVRAADANYAAQVSAIAMRLSAAYGDLGEQSGRAGRNTDLILDSDWKQETAIVLAQLIIQAEKIDELKPPKRFAATHVTMRRLAASIRTMTSLYARGIDNLDVNLISRAITELLKINALTSTATAQLSLAGQNRSADGYADKQSYGDRWPLRVDAVVMQCRQNLDGLPEVVAVDAAGKIYAVNGIAKDNRSYLPIEPIWLPNPTVRGARIPIKELLDLGLTQCS